nr:hypothetical protein [Treponemataceae bacterium]
YGISDFFTNGNEYSNLNKSGMLFADLQKTDKGLYLLDLSSDIVYFISNENLANNNKKLERVLYKKDITSISASKDGKFIAVSYDSEVDVTLRANVSIYNTETKKWFNVKGNGMIQNVLVQNGADTYLVTTKYAHHIYSSLISKLDIDAKGNISSVASVNAVNFALNQNPLSYADLADGTFAIAVSENGNYSILVSDLNGNVSASYKAPQDRMMIKQLSASNGIVAFSYAVSGSMPRLGTLNVKSGEFRLDGTDFSGGVFFPVIMDDANIAYVGQFCKKNSIFARANSSLNASVSSASKTSGASGSVAGLDADLSSSEFAVSLDKLNENSKKYNGLNYYTKFLFVPIAITYSRDYVPGSDCYYWQPVGIDLFSTNPWKDGHFRLFAGWGAETNSITAHAIFFNNSDTTTDAFYYNVESTSEVDFKYGWKLSNLKVDLSSYLPFNDGNGLRFSASTFTNYGRRNNKNYDLSKLGSGDSFDEMIDNTFGEIANYFNTMTVGCAISEDRRLYLYSEDSVSVEYSYLENFGTGKYSKAGIIVGSDLYYLYKGIPTQTEKIEGYRNTLELGIDTTVYFPGFVPNLVESTRFTYNAPAKFIFSLFPLDFANSCGADSFFMSGLKDTFDMSDLVFVGHGEVVLFGMQIQRAIPGIELLYLNDFKVSFTMYEFLFDSNMSVDFFHMGHFAEYLTGAIPLTSWFYCGLRADLGMAINMGTFSGASIGTFFVEGMIGCAGANDAQISMGFELAY